MATRDKYNYTQQTNLWGPINYIDVPSYSATSVGTTGDAYLVRNFLKQFFPFLDLSVKKTAGGSVNVAIQNFRVKFNFTEGGILKEFVLNAKSLEDVLEPLFEGQGFDGMTDSSYSIPLPPMYNDEGQDVSYGYGYLFVRNENTDGYYDVNLDLPTVRGGVIKYKFKVAYVSNIGLQDKIIEIPQKTIDYIKSNGVIPTVNIPQGIYPTPTQTNQSDLVTLEKGTINPASAVNLTLAQKDMVYFLAAVGIVPFEYIEENFKTAGTYQTTLIIIQELIAMDLVVPDNSQIPPLYQLTETGYDIFESFEGTIPKLLTPVVPKIELTTLEQEIIDFLLEKQKENVDVNLDRIKIEFQNRNYQQPILMKAISNLLVANLIDTKSGNNNIFYFVNEAGFASIGKAVLTTLEQEIINLLSELEEIFASVTIEILKSKTSYSEFMVEDRLFGLVNKGFVNQKKQDSIISYSLNESGLDLVTANDKTTVDAASLLTREPKTTASIGELAISEFIEKNIAIFNDMAQNAPELFDALGEGLLLVKKLASKDTGEPFPLISEENKLQLEDALSDDDFDLDEAELEQIDLSGIENDLELSDDELGDLDLDEFNELADFVENELMPSTKLKPVLLEILKILYITNSKLTADNIKNDLSMQEIFLNHKAVFNRLIELRDLQLVQEINSASNGII